MKTLFDRIATAGAHAGMAVVSLKGRDLGKVYFVTAVEGRRLSLADGRGRGIDKIKRKHIGHIRFLGSIMSEEEAKVFLASDLINREKDIVIRKEIDKFLDKIKYQGEEGIDA